MTAKTITGTDEQTVALKMTYNKGNQLVTMTNGTDKLTYGYDKNGSMVQKVLSSKQYGKLTDTYAYNSLDQLVSYTGYDGYQQRFAYDANGMRLSKSEYGNSDRSTLEELLRGNIAGLPEVIQPAEEVPEGYEWATTEYLYDITQEYYQVIEQTTTKDNTTTTTAYAHGVERIAAYDTNATTQYIYDGRGSVAQTISAPAAGTSVSAALPQVEVQSYAYTAFGEQMGSKTSGFAYNAEDYDAGTGMINLRMRQYEPAMNRFSQKDKLQRGLCNSVILSRYIYAQNSPLIFADPSGLEVTITFIDSNENISQTNPHFEFGTNIESVKKRISELVNAANQGYNAMLDSCNEDIQEAVLATKNEFKQLGLDILDESNERKANETFAKYCVIRSLEIAYEYGRNHSTPFSTEETVRIGELHILNHTKVDDETTELVENEGTVQESNAGDKNAQRCVHYVTNPYKGTVLYTQLKDMASKWDKKYGNSKEVPTSPLTYTSPLHMALVGTPSRALVQKKLTNTEMQENVLLAVSIGNEGIKIKLPGETEYMQLYSPDAKKFGVAAQKELIIESGIISPLTICFTNILGDEENPYPIDCAQNHVFMMNSPYKYSGLNADVWMGDFQTYNLTSPDPIIGFDFVILNHDPYGLEILINKYENVFGPTVGR